MGLMMMMMMIENVVLVCCLMLCVRWIQMFLSVLLLQLLHLQFHLKMILHLIHSLLLRFEYHIFFLFVLLLVNVLSTHKKQTFSSFVQKRFSFCPETFSSFLSRNVFELCPETHIKDHKPNARKCATFFISAIA